MMFDKDQLYAGLIMLVVSLWGGIVGYYRRVQQGMVHTWFRFFGELSSSVLAGMCLGTMGMAADLHPYINLGLAAIGGHLGTAFFDMAESGVKAFFERSLNKNQ